MQMTEQQRARIVELADVAEWTHAELRGLRAVDQDYGPLLIAQRDASAEAFRIARRLDRRAPPLRRSIASLSYSCGAFSPVYEKAITLAMGARQ